MEKKVDQTKISKTGKNETEQSLTDTDNMSDFIEDESENSLDAQKQREAMLGFRKFGKELMTAAVDVLREEFKQIAIEGGQHGAKIALLGEDLVKKHQKEIDNKESELLELKREKRELENELTKQKVRNEELETTIKQKEEEIERMQDEIDQMKRLMIKKEKELASNQTVPNERENQLKAELEKLKKKYNHVSARFQAKNSSDNVAQSELPKLRKRITELELQLEQTKGKKKK
ncbi:coiled-coil domain-containing protein 102A-like [Mytilus edulis]|uniref:coiled-coil domain-containing protein 102A-like n=1 Tax=Mytilus edulis TaxID=6550 RepID=UPI0039F0DB3E